MTDLRSESTAAADRYFPAATPDCPTFVDDTEWHPIIDGAAYLRELGAMLRATVSGDTVSIVGLELDPDVDLDGREPGSAGYEPLGDLLARRAAAGVGVRVVLASRVIASSIPGPMLGGFRAGALNTRRLREHRPAGSSTAPLAGRVLLDHAGTLLGSNHQKAVVIHSGGRLTAFVGGVDLVTDRFDTAPHDRLRLRGRRWGWHDITVRLRGPAAERVWHNFDHRWREAATLPRKKFFLQPFVRVPLNEATVVDAPGPAPATPSVAQTGVAVRVMRSISGVKIDSALPWQRVMRRHTSPDGVREIYETIAAALSAARRYIYLEDQYLCEAPGGNPAYELYPHLRAAAARGVKVVLVGSGVRDPEDTGVHLWPINRSLNRDLRGKIADQLDDAHRNNLAVNRVDCLTVHAKLILVDDEFACIGSANMFSRSMAGSDAELSSAVATSTTLVRDLRVDVWAEHLRTPVTPELRAALADLDTALGMWRPEWAAGGRDLPAVLAQPKRVLRLVGP